MVSGKRHALIIGESELELVPKELWRHPVVLARARKLEKNPGEMLLQSGEVYKAMRGIPEEGRRGRPDLVHFALTIATDSPAFAEGRLEVILHLRDNSIVRIREGLRPPKEYSRFCGLAEQLLLKGRVPAEGDWLMKIEPGKKTLAELAEETGTETLIFDSGGELTTVSELSGILGGEGKTLVVGGFPHGTFHSRPEGRTITISKKELLAGTVVGFISAALGDQR
ncbi:MAG: hypothetical protein V1820_04135 [archaeon]